MPTTPTKKLPPRFSIVAMVRDEEWQLPDLFAGLEDFLARGGELVAMDTGSTDETRTIARRFGCRVEEVNDRFDTELDAAAAAEIERRFARAGEGPLVAAGQRLFHFADARQHAGSLTSNSFVLQLDGGDRVLAMDIDALDRCIERGNVRGFEYDQLYGNARLRIARFYDRTRYRWEGRVHEMLTATVQDDGTSTVRCDPTQLLVRHNKDQEKERNYLAGLALQVMEDPQQPRWWHYLGRELFYLKWFESAIAVLEAHIAMNTWPVERSQSACFIGESLEALERAAEAKAFYRRAAELDAARREPLLRLAAVQSRLGEFEAAVEHARAALAIPHISALPEPEANYTWVPHSILYWALFWLGRRDEARAHWETCMELAPMESRAEQYARLFPPAGHASTGSSPAAVREG